MWCVCTKWLPSLLPDIDGLGYPLVERQSALCIISPLLIRKVFLTAHCCTVTSSYKDFKSSKQLNTEPLCFINTKHGLTHNGRNRMYYIRPDWSSVTK